MNGKTLRPNWVSTHLLSSSGKNPSWASIGDMFAMSFNLFGRSESCTSFWRSNSSLKCFSSSFHMSHTQEKHSSVYVSVWHVTCQPKNTDPTVHRLKVAWMLSLEIGDWWYVYKSQCIKDCSKPLLLFLQLFFLSGRFFLHLLHSAGHTSICFSMPRFVSPYGTDFSANIPGRHQT